MKNKWKKPAMLTFRENALDKQKIISRPLMHNQKSPWDKHIRHANLHGGIGLSDYSFQKEAIQKDCKACKGIEWVLCAWPSLQDDEEVPTLELCCTEKEGEELSEKSKQRPDWKNMTN